MDFIDLKSQYAALRDNINARIQKVLDHGQYILGPEVKEMEQADRQIAAAELRKTIAETALANHQAQIKHAYVERVGAMTGQGVSSVFSFGRSAGVLEGVLAASGVPYTLVTPQTWQKAVGLRGGKDGSRERAMQQFPDQASLFARKKDDGRADATLIAIYGMKQSN